MNDIKNIKGRSYLFFGMMMFLVFMLIDTIVQLSLMGIVGGSFISWDNWVKLISRISPAILWMILFIITNKVSIKRLDFDFMKITKKNSAENYVIAIGFVGIAVLFNYISWGNFKLLSEYNNLGFMGFIIQHIYYFSEIIIVTALIVLFQKACEVWFKKINIPYGGILVGITWGLAHIFTQNDLFVGTMAFVYGIGFGALYLVLNRNYKVTVIFLFLMFVL